jgi:enamine deaminase RidA (YjgF/YER057c/UK114 family)
VSRAQSRGRRLSSGSPFESAYGYSRAIVRGDEVLISGTTGYDYAVMAMPDDPAAQTRNIYATFAAVLSEAGGGLADIVRLRTFVNDASHCDSVLKVQGEIFRDIRPAATIVIVSGLLMPEMKVEIEAEARLKKAGLRRRHRPRDRRIAEQRRQGGL